MRCLALPPFLDLRIKSLHDKGMNVTLVKALVALVPTCVLILGTAAWFSRRKSMSALLMMTGATCLLTVVLTHVCEALHWFPWMRWGEEHSVGHYLDLSSAILGLLLLFAGILLYALEKRRGMT
jgi:hypothetical protein